MINRNEKYTFTYTDNDGITNSLTIEKDMFTWMELIREFHFFLKGRGYIFAEGKIFTLKKGEYEY